MTPGKMMFIFTAFLIVFVAVIPHLIWFVGWIFSLIMGQHLRYAPFGWTVLGLVTAVVLLLSYGFFIGRWQFRVREWSYFNKDIPEAFDGFKIVHISDLHLCTFDDRPEMLDRVAYIVNGQSPDLICFTGDLVTTGRQEAEPYTFKLSKFSAKSGVVSVLGNHDFLIYARKFRNDDERKTAVGNLADYENVTLGWTLLRNSSKRIDASDGSHITIVGVDNRNCSNQGFRTIDMGNLPLAMEGTDGFRILLSHDPSHWEAEVIPDTDISLTLSGHTHASQVSFFGWNLASLMFKQSYGRYDIDGQTLYVNPGLGCTAPFRIGARPEITTIILRRYGRTNTQLTQ